MKPALAHIVVRAHRALTLTCLSLLLPRDQILKQLPAGARDRLHGLVEGGLVEPRGGAVAGDLADKLQRGGLEFLVRRALLGAAQLLDIAAHTVSFLSLYDILCLFHERIRPSTPGL